MGMHFQASWYTASFSNYINNEGVWCLYICCQIWSCFSLFINHCNNCVMAQYGLSHQISCTYVICSWMSAVKPVVQLLWMWLWVLIHSFSWVLDPCFNWVNSCGSFALTVTQSIVTHTSLSHCHQCQAWGNITWMLSSFFLSCFFTPSQPQSCINLK